MILLVHLRWTLVYKLRQNRWSECRGVIFGGEREVPVGMAPARAARAPATSSTLNAWTSKGGVDLQNRQAPRGCARDWSALGMERLLTPLSCFPQGEPIRLAQDILFTTCADAAIR